jgi:hypothetical protein
LYSAVSVAVSVFDTVYERETFVLASDQRRKL